MQKKNIPLLCLITLLQGMVFYAAIATLYRQAAGLSIFQITALEGISTALSLALEIPWGRLADRLGYKRTLILCNVLFFVSKLIFWRADSFGAFLAERLLLAVVISGLSGVDISMLYLSAPKAQAQRNLGWYHACGEAGLLLSGLVYVGLLSGQYRLSALWTAAAYGLAAVLTFFLAEVREPAAREKHERLLPLLRTQLHTPGLLAAVLCGALAGEVIHCVTVYFNQLQYVRCGLGDRAIGIAFGIAAVAGLLGPLSGGLTRRLGVRRTGLWLLLGAAACAAGLAFTRSGLLSIGLIALMSLLSALFSPLISSIENDLITTSDRATALSVDAMIVDSVILTLDLGLGRAADGSLTLALGLCALGTLIAAALFSRIPKSNRSKGT